MSKTAYQYGENYDRLQEGKEILPCPYVFPCIMECASEKNFKYFRTHVVFMEKNGMYFAWDSPVFEDDEKTFEAANATIGIIKFPYVRPKPVT